MDCEASMEHLLERMVLDPSAEPTNLPLSLLKAITNDFSDHMKIGSGGFAHVYKGELQNGTVIAVKKLLNCFDMDEEKFIREVGCLMKAKHKNIVRFLGYCSDTQGKILNYEGKVIQAEERQRLLCFEFLSNGSLDKYITDVSKGLEWRTRYKIIKGICEGLHYLHQDIHIVHSDLKPANILLDENMVPKIADFGLARCFDGKQSRTIASKVIGTLGYLAPETYDGFITFKSDIYSIGIVIMEILTGRKGYCDIQNLLQSWSTRFELSLEDIWLQHVEVCAEIGKKCIDHNPTDRPDTFFLIQKLDQVQRMSGCIETDISTSSATQGSLVHEQSIVPVRKPLHSCFPTGTKITGLKDLKYFMNGHVLPSSTLLVRIARMDFGKEEMALKWAHEQRTLYGLLPPDAKLKLYTEREGNEMAKEAERRAAIAGLRELDRLTGRMVSDMIKGRDIDTIRRSYSFR